MRHPEAVQARIRAGADARVSAGGAPWLRDDGWLLRIDEANGQRHYRDLPSGTGYAEACRQRDEELASDPRYVSAWLMQKKFGAR